MQVHGERGFVFGVLLGVVALLLCTLPGQAQERSAVIPSPNDQTGEMRAMANSIRALETEVRALTAQLAQVRADQQQGREEARQLRLALENAKAPMPLPANGSQTDAYSLLPSTHEVPIPAKIFPANEPPAGDHNIEQRIDAVGEDLKLIDAKVSEQSQTKIESGSKYRVRLSGIVLLNFFDDRGVVDSQDIPEIAQQPGTLTSAGTFGGSLRQTQIGLEAFGPDVAGAHTSADLKFDFAGGFPDVPNGVSMGIIRLRTGTIHFDWANTSIIAGQDQLFFAPLAPSSMASLATPALSYAGNLWGWAPQVRVEHRIGLGHGSHLLLQGGILDSLSVETPESPYLRAPTWGERSGQPAYASRVSWNLPMGGEELTLGAGGYYGRQFWGLGRNVDGWAGTVDVTLPLGEFFELSGEFYRGRAVGDLSGAIGQDVLFSGPFANSTTEVKGLDSMGGWAQLKFKPTAKLEFNAAFGQDNPFAGELRRFPDSQSFYGVLLSRNRTPLVNFIYQLRSDILFSAEYRRLRTFELDHGSNSADHISLSVGYAF